jgi:hypothetical protein
MTYRQRIILAAVAGALVGLAVGALWVYSGSRGHAGRLDGAERDLAFTRMEATLGAATVEAQRGSYEISRQLASDFFTRLQARIGEAEVPQRQELSGILERRDAMITALSRGDPQSGSMMAQLFTRFRIAMGEPVGPTDATNSPVSPPPAASPPGAAPATPDSQ